MSQKQPLWISAHLLKFVGVCLIVTFVRLLVHDPRGTTTQPQDDLKSIPEAMTTATTKQHSQVKFSIVVNAANLMPGSMVYGKVGPLRAYRDVADEFEKLYPDTHIDLRVLPRERPWMITQQLGEMAPDIMDMNTGDVWQDADKGWYLPLNEYLEKPNPFIKPGEPGSEKWWDLVKYQDFCRGLVFTDGKYYVFCFDIIAAAIYYNKNLFDSLGLQKPHDWEEFIALQKKLKDAGYTPLGLGVSWAVSDWVLDFVFDQFYYDIFEGIDVYQDPRRGNFLDWNEIVFLNQKGFFTSKDPRWVAMWRAIHRWRSFWNKSLTASPVELFLNKKAGMIWDLSPLTLLFKLDQRIDFDWGVTYFPPMTSSTSEFCVGAEPCVVAGARSQLCVTKTAFSDTKSTSTSERLKRVIAFLQFITIPRNYELIVNEAPMNIPNIVGAKVPPHLSPFVDIASRRMNPSKWQFTFNNRFSDTIQRMANLYIENGISEAEFLRWIDETMQRAIEDSIRHKDPHFDELEKNWKKLASRRIGKAGLPTGAIEGMMAGH